MGVTASCDFSGVQFGRYRTGFVYVCTLRNATSEENLS